MPRNRFCHACFWRFHALSSRSRGNAGKSVAATRQKLPAENPIAVNVAGRTRKHGFLR